MITKATATAAALVILTIANSVGFVRSEETVGALKVEFDGPGEGDMTLTETVQVSSVVATPPDAAVALILSGPSDFWFFVNDPAGDEVSYYLGPINEGDYHVYFITNGNERVAVEVVLSGYDGPSVLPLHSASGAVERLTPLLLPVAPAASIEQGHSDLDEPGVILIAEKYGVFGAGAWAAGIKHRVRSDLFEGDCLITGDAIVSTFPIFRLDSIVYTIFPLNKGSWDSEVDFSYVLPAVPLYHRSFSLTFYPDASDPITNSTNPFWHSLWSVSPLDQVPNSTRGLVQSGICTLT